MKFDRGACGGNAGAAGAEGVSKQLMHFKYQTKFHTTGPISLYAMKVHPPPHLLRPVATAEPGVFFSVGIPPANSPPSCGACGAAAGAADVFIPPPPMGGGRAIAAAPIPPPDGLAS